MLQSLKHRYCSGIRENDITLNNKIPIHIRMKAGSKAIFATLDRLWKVSFSLHAHTPTVNIPNPSSFGNEIITLLN